MDNWIPIKDLPGYTRGLKRWLQNQQRNNPTIELLKKPSYYIMVNTIALKDLNDSYCKKEQEQSRIDHLEDQLANLENLLRVQHNSTKLKIDTLQKVCIELQQLINNRI